MDLESLRLFVDLADTHSFSKTAERSYMSQSAVSQRIRSLEQEFGYVLVERGKGRPGAHFTEAGVRLLTGARELLSRADELKREMAELSGAVSGSLRVATVYSIGLHALTPAISQYLAEFPQVNLHVEYLRTNRIYESLLAGTIDCGIVACPKAMPQIEVIPLHTETLALILPPDHPLASRESVPLSELDGMPFVAFDHDIPTRGLIDSALAEAGASVEIVHEFDNIETVKRVVEIGQGISLVPEGTVVREVRDGTLVVRPLEGVTIQRPTGVLLKKGRVPSNALSRFMNVLAETLASEETLPGLKRELRKEKAARLVK
ncbi:MAG: LysR family transcriptional regulator [Armatimonadetes bacterium]|nr:LysR family transcriptional regulator [Armatimonadota bacterium]